MKQERALQALRKHDHLPWPETCDEPDPQRKTESGCEIGRLACKPYSPLYFLVSLVGPPSLFTLLWRRAGRWTGGRPQEKGEGSSCVLRWGIKNIFEGWWEWRRWRWRRRVDEDVCGLEYRLTFDFSRNFFPFEEEGTQRICSLRRVNWSICWWEVVW